MTNVEIGGRRPERKVREMGNGKWEMGKGKKERKMVQSVDCTKGVSSEMRGPDHVIWAASNVMRDGTVRY